MFRHSQLRRLLPLALALCGQVFADDQSPQTQEPKLTSPSAQETRNEYTRSRTEPTEQATSNRGTAEAAAPDSPAATTPAAATVPAVAEAASDTADPRDAHFAAMRSDLAVRVPTPHLNAPVAWNQLVYEDGQLVFGARQSLGTILWETALDLGDYAMRSIYLVGGRDARELAALRMYKEVIGHGGLDLRGDGRLDLATANPHFTGVIRVTGAELWLNEQGSLKKHPPIQVSAGGRFVIDNSDVQHVMNKRVNGANLDLSSGTFRYLTRNNAAALERIGTFTVGQGGSRFEVSGGGPGKLGTTLTIGRLRVTQPAAHLDFVASHGSDFAQNTNLRFLKRPALLHGVLPHTTVNGRDWAMVDDQNRLRAYDGYEKGSDKNWGPSVNAAPATNLLVSADRSLASLKFEGVGLGGTDEEGNPLGRVVDLQKHTLTITGAGILATGDEFRHTLVGGTLTTTRANHEIHVSGEGGLALENTILAEGAQGGTGLVKTGDGVLHLTSPKGVIGGGVNDNSFTGDVYVNQGSLVLFRKKGGVANLPSLNIYVGAGQGDAMLVTKGGSEQINDKATVTLRGGPKGEAVYRLDRTQPPRGPRETLHKLRIEGSGVIEFYSSYVGGGGGIDDNTKTILYLTELEIDGELTIRGWDAFNTHLLIDSKEAPSEAFLSKIKFEGKYLNKVFVEKFYAKDKNKDYWEIKAEFEYVPPSYPPPPDAPEPATTGAVIGAGALSLAAWRLLGERARRPVS